MKVLSLFSGVGGFDMGLENAGMETVFQCEWDKHANSILHRHWPDVPKWDDVSTLTGKHILANAPVVDVVAWGSPCQDLSVAGKRAGLEGGRSGLFHEGIRIIKELQEESNGQYPRISIWENVVGALNSNRGADFGVILDEMAEAGALAIEWAVLDAQYFGVPQRRRRVFVIAIFDPVLAERSPNPLLPVAESLPGHLTKSKPKRQSAARTLTESTRTDGSWWDGRDTAEALTTTSNEQRMPDKQRFQAVVEGYTPSSFANYTEGVGTLRSNGGDLGGGSETLVTEPIAYHFDALSSNSMKSSNPDSGVNQVDTARTLDTWRPDPSLNQGGLAIVEPMLAFDTQFGSNANVTEDVAPTLKSSQQSPSVAYSIREDAKANNFSATELDHANSLSALRPSPQSHHAQMFIAESTMAVRRLTPLECERLMGWPDNHTLTKADGTIQADTHRYKQCGNGVASPVAQWIAKHLLNI
jgi:DNA (cytosine-5)-methyltransferase 1